MKLSKTIKRALLFVFAIGLIFGIRFAWISFPNISGYGAKNLCSCMFVAGREEKTVQQEELNDFPVNLGTFTVNKEDSSATGTVLGLAKRKAIYRKGLGCTLVNDFSEKEIRQQPFTAGIKPLFNTDTIPWPMGDLLKDSIPLGLDLIKLKTAVNNAFAEPGASKKINTRALLVLYDGKLVAEQYAPGFTKNTVMLGWSMSKSIMSALIGILVKQGKLNINDPAPVAQWNDASKPKHEITTGQLLQQTTGLNFLEDYTKASSVTDMLFKKGDMAAYAASRPLKNKPGTVFNYSSGNSNILSSVIRRIVGDQEYHSFPYKALFQRTGIYSMVLEPDASGTFVGSSYSYATARDWARFGLLYYNDGIYNGERILPEGWVKKSSAPSAADKQKIYGYQFWLNGFDKKDLSKRWYPDVPADMFFADGYGGQDVYIIPSRKTVIVRLGLHVLDDNKMIKEILAGLPH